jgi:hypothetical protein
METKFKCDRCQQTKVNTDPNTTGFAVNNKDEKICYECCGEVDAFELKILKPKQKYVLYLDREKKTLSNWPGTFVIQLESIKIGKHNFAGKRYDAWFRYAGFDYHMVQIGDNTQIAHITKTKDKSL